MSVAKRDPASFALNARRQLTQELRSLAIFSVPRSSALLHYLAVLEAESFKASVFSQCSPVAIFGAHRLAVESTTHAIPAIFEQCPQDESAPDQTINEETYFQAHELYTFTHKYDKIDYSYRLADRGHWDISVAQKDPRISFSYVSSEVDAADTLARAREMLAKLSKDRPSLNPDDVKDLFEKLKTVLSDRTRLVQPETCEYVIDGAVLSIMRDLAKTLSQNMNVGMASDVKVGQLTFGDFRAFWSALLALIQIHTLAHELACEGDFTKFALRTSVIRKPRATMTALLASAAGVSNEAAEFILKCYSYDPKINGKGPLCQPLIPIAGDNVCVSSSLAAFFDFERNFFKLLHRSPLLLPFRASIDDQKEPIAIRYLSAFFPTSEYGTKDCVPVPKTDIDLLVYDRRTGFTLVIQHKWVTAPETPEDSSSNDEYLQKGITQGIEARDYLRLNQNYIREVLKLSVAAPVSRVECVTVCRGLEGSSFMEPSDVPVVMEQAFEALFKQSGGLDALWSLLQTRPDKVLAAEQAVDGKMVVQLGEYEFVMPALGF